MFLTPSAPPFTTHTQKPRGLFYWPFWGGCTGITLCCFVGYSTRRLVFSLPLRYFVRVFFSPFSIAITSLGEESANLSVFVRLFDLRLFGFVCFLFLFVFGKSCGLWLWHSLDFSLTFFIFSKVMMCRNLTADKATQYIPDYGMTNLLKAYNVFGARRSKYALLFAKGFTANRSWARAQHFLQECMCAYQISARSAGWSEHLLSAWRGVWSVKTLISIGFPSMAIE